MIMIGYAVARQKSAFYAWAVILQCCVISFHSSQRKWICSGPHSRPVLELSPPNLVNPSILKLLVTTEMIKTRSSATVRSLFVFQLLPWIWQWSFATLPQAAFLGELRDERPLASSLWSTPIFHQTQNLISVKLLLRLSLGISMGLATKLSIKQEMIATQS